MGVVPVGGLRTVHGWQEALLGPRSLSTQQDKAEDRERRPRSQPRSGGDRGWWNWPAQRGCVPDPYWLCPAAPGLCLSHSHAHTFQRIHMCTCTPMHLHTRTCLYTHCHPTEDSGSGSDTCPDQKTSLGRHWVR